ncbi:hypothetical protein [Paenibacillus sp. FSL K6-2859]|uniref:hypothetical protein n=1 Tax=Paenibacillus sp. FSL K6-2859 TaxID=2921482 RepID=UPI0030F4D756
MDYYTNHSVHLRVLYAKYGSDMVSAVHARIVSDKLREPWHTDAEVLAIIRDLDRAYRDITVPPSLRI